jgi:acetyl-CoA/propionyl-CoA carboxylase biotin carboxyl carrier protein
MLSKVLVANRGEIAARVIKTCAELGIGTVAIYSDADKDALHVRLADQCVSLPGVSAVETYLNQAAIVQACRHTGADAIHPGYGFLAENAEFAQLVESHGITFVGPSSQAIAQLGDKVRARETAVIAGVPVVPGSTKSVAVAEEVVLFGETYGWPVAIKAVHGGGGRGMRVVRTPAEAASAMDSARAESTAAFGNGALYLERYLEQARHVEVQIFADMHGKALWLGDRDCSVQRLHQKIVEEAPAPFLSRKMREEMGNSSVRLARNVGYVGAGTVEYLVEGENFYFLEVNTRIQVEHPVTEMVLGIDLVREQLLVAGGAELTWESGVTPCGHAIECRVNAEDPTRSFRPGPGRIDELMVPMLPGIRCDFGYESGDSVPPHYDSLIGKVIAWAPTRELALSRLVNVLDASRFVGVPTTVPMICQILRNEEMRTAPVHTRWLESRLSGLLATIPPQLEASSDSTLETGTPAITEVWLGNRRYLVPAAPLSKSGRPAQPRQVGTRDRGLPQEGGDSAAGGAVLSPIHGIVRDIAVKTGQVVAEGELLLKIEAMKMEIAINAVCAGTVDDIRVSAQENVSADQHLMTVTALVAVTG